jgi:hypothetical protein
MKVFHDPVKMVISTRRGRAARMVTKGKVSEMKIFYEPMERVKKMVIATSGKSSAFEH